MSDLRSLLEETARTAAAGPDAFARLAERRRKRARARRLGAMILGLVVGAAGVIAVLVSLRDDPRPIPGSKPIPKGYYILLRDEIGSETGDAGRYMLDATTNLPNGTAAFFQIEYETFGEGFGGRVSDGRLEFPVINANCLLDDDGCKALPSELESPSPPNTPGWSGA